MVRSVSTVAVFMLLYKLLRAYLYCIFIVFQATWDSIDNRRRNLNLDYSILT